METTNILIAFYSRNGTTEALAQAIAEGARAAGAEVRLRRVRELVGEEVMAKAPGWSENAKRMNHTPLTPPSHSPLSLTPSQKKGERKRREKKSNRREAHTREGDRDQV